MPNPTWLTPKLKKQIKAYQRRNGLKPDGIPGEDTWASVVSYETKAMEAAFPSAPPKVYSFTRGGETYSYGRKQIRPGIDNDPANLLPQLADALEIIIPAMRAEGHDPVLFEGDRRKARARRLARRGTGIKDSIHCYQGAADIISEAMWWDAGPRFWKSLERHALRNGLFVLTHTRGKHKGERRDLPHVQLVPQNARAQNAFRRLTDAQRLEKYA